MNACKVGNFARRIRSSAVSADGSRSNKLAPDAIPTLDDLGDLANRYGVSLISCILRWLEYTERRSMIVISRDEFVLWSKSSEPALKTGLYMRTRKASPIEVPKNSLIRRKDLANIARDGIKHPPEVWLNEDSTELTIHSDRYDQVISVLLFGSASRRESPEIELEENSFDRFGRRSRGRFGN